MNTKTQQALKDIVIKKNAKLQLDLKASDGVAIWITEEINNRN